MNNTAENNLNTEFATSEELQNLHGQLEKLVTHHQPALKEIDAITGVERVLEWIRSCQEGSAKAERNLYIKGQQTLDDTQKRLHLALEEQQHMEDESPMAAASNVGERDVERYAKASGHANTAASTLANIVDGTKH